MDLGLDGKVAMITGGSRGLGRQAALALAREGCKVAICARGAEALEETVAEFRGLGYQAHGTQAMLPARMTRFASTRRPSTTWATRTSW